MTTTFNEYVHKTKDLFKKGERESMEQHFHSYIRRMLTRDNDPMTLIKKEGSMYYLDYDDGGFYVFEYQHALTEQLSSFHPELLVYEDTWYYQRSEPYTNWFRCVVPLEHDTPLLFSLLVKEYYELNPKWVIDVCKLDANLFYSSEKADIPDFLLSLPSVFKELVLQLPSFRLFHTTGVIT